jgi:cytoskeletal protein RodZ
MLSNLETYTDKLIQIILIGQPEFEKMLNQNNLRQLKQRIAIRTTLSPLSQQESMTYIQHRLDKADVSDAAIFTKGALKLIVNKTEGIPRLLNILCDNALITGYGYQQKPVTSRTVKEVIADFEEKRKFPILKWAIVSSTVFLLLGAICWFFPYKNQALSGFRSIAVSLNSRTSQSKEGLVSLSPVKDEISEPTTNIVPLATTVQEPTNPINPSKYVNNADITGIKENDLDIYKNKNGKYDIKDKSTKLQGKNNPLTTSLKDFLFGGATKSN